MFKKVSNISVTTHANIIINFNNIFSDLAIPKYLSIFSIIFIRILLSTGTMKLTDWHVFFFLSFINAKYSLLQWIEKSLWIWKYVFYAPFSKKVSGLRMYLCFGMSEYNCLNNSLQIAIPAQSCKSYVRCLCG